MHLHGRSFEIILNLRKEGILLQLRFLNSLEKVFTDSDLNCKECAVFSCLKNEPLNFQLAYRTEENISCPVFVKITSDLDLTLYSVGYVPVLGSGNVSFPEQYKLGLFPDILWPKKINPTVVKAKNPWNEFRLENDEANYLKAHRSWQTLWLCANENGKSKHIGEHEVTVEFFERQTGKLLSTATATVNVIDAKLPEQKLMYTNWFHCDCLADTYRVEMFTDEFFEIFEGYVKTAAENGMNMILTPCFTPPLDTGIGLKRKKAQLVSVVKKKGKYIFDFSLLKRFVDICRKAGIKYFEHSHLFTQWGAKYCPNIYCTVGGRERLLFGWETEATDPEYTGFLRQYLTELKEFLKSENLTKKILFHISDEPMGSHAESYKKAKEQIIDLLDGFTVGDALSHYSLYEDGLVKMPIVLTDKIGDFLGKCNNLWCYYTGNQQASLSNRLIVNSSERNRMLGVQMYYHKIKGFLHWGYNYYYDILSHGLFDPKVNPEGYGVLAGTSYAVYPNSDGTALQSIRQKVFYEGINDMRALSLLERLYGREFTVKLIEKHFGRVDFTTEAESPEKLIDFRNEVNKFIEM